MASNPSISLATNVWLPGKTYEIGDMFYNTDTGTLHMVTSKCQSFHEILEYLLKIRDTVNMLKLLKQHPLAGDLNGR